MSIDTMTIDWSECIVIFNSLIENIEQLREAIGANDIDDDELYDAEESLNDYMTLLARLRDRYLELSDKGELSEALKKKLVTIC